VATLTADEGDELIAQIGRGRTELQVASHPTTDYLYDISQDAPVVPADLTFRPDRRDLARVDVSFRNNRAAKGMEFRSAVWRGDYGYNLLPTPTQAERTDWVSSDTDWAQNALVNQQLQISSDSLDRYRAGTTSHMEFFGPIQRPRIDSYYRPVRVGNAVYVEVPGWGDSVPGHVGTTFNNVDVENKVKMYQGDTLLRASDTDTLAGYRTPLILAPEKTRYRLVSDNARGTWANDYSTTTRTEWAFDSQQGAAGVLETLPLIQLDYTVEGMDASGKAHRHTDITVTPSHLQGAPSSDTIKTVSLDISYDDGATWHHTTLTRTAQGWNTQLDAPAHAQFVTLRTSAADTEGNTVTQSITRAFGLK
jgi:hypothetical protein